MNSLEQIEQLQAELLSVQRPRRDDVGVITLEADEETLDPEESVAVGYGLQADGAWSIQLRVITGFRRALDLANHLVSIVRHRNWPCVLREIEEARIPTKADVLRARADPGMTSPGGPLHLGISVGHAEGTSGSLGAYVYRNKQVCILSASHVLARSGDAKEGNWIHRPGPGDIAALSRGTRIASLADFTVLTSRNPNSIDAAVAVLDQDRLDMARAADYNRLPAGFGCLREGEDLGDVLDAREVPLGSRVGKFGRTTGYTEGTVTAVNLSEISARVNNISGRRIQYRGVLEVTWDDPPASGFSLPGDSGSIVFTLDQLRPVGIHVVGGRAVEGSGVSYACHLLPALQHLNCALLFG